jgi:hypothetical protein
MPEHPARLSECTKDFIFPIRTEGLTAIPRNIIAFVLTAKGRELPPRQAKTVERPKEATPIPMGISYTGQVLVHPHSPIDVEITIWGPMTGKFPLRSAFQLQSEFQLHVPFIAENVRLKSRECFCTYCMSCEWDTI